MASNLPAVRQQSAALSDDEMAQLLKQAKMYIDHGVLPPCIKTPQQALQVVQQGRELGLPMQAALQNIYPIKGMTMISARATIALLKRAGYQVYPLEVNKDRATARFINPQGVAFDYTVSWEEAQAGGWNVGPDGKEKFAWRNRKVMLYNRSITQGAKMFAAEALLLPPMEEDDSFSVYDPEDEEFVSPEVARQREQHHSLPLRAAARSGKLFKEGEEPLNSDGQGEPVDAEYREAEPEQEPRRNGHWTGSAKERKAFLAFLKAHELSEDDGKRILADWMHKPEPLELFAEFPHDRARAQRILLGWLMSNRPEDPEKHWMKNPAERAHFWALMGEQGLDTEAVHERVPRTGTFPGTLDELVDFVLHSKPEDRWQPGLPGMDLDEVA